MKPTVKDLKDRISELEVTVVRVIAERDEARRALGAALAAQPPVFVPSNFQALATASDRCRNCGATGPHICVWCKAGG